jgi:spoIIIJ-associated protein
MRTAEGTGRTVEEAKAAALAELGVSEEEADIEVLHEESRGILGILGGGGAVRVRATLRRSLGSAAQEFLTGLLERMGCQVAVTVKSEDPECAELEMSGKDIAIVIGRRGETIDALQLLAAVAANRAANSGGRIVLNAEGYRERRQKALENLARSSAAKAKQTGKEVVIPDLKPYERRIVHITLADDPDVHTYSEGEGRSRKIIVSPGPGPEGAQQE